MAGNSIAALALDQGGGMQRGRKAEGCPGWGVIRAPAGTRCLCHDVSWQEHEKGRRTSVSALLCVALPTPQTHGLTAVLSVHWQRQLQLDAIV